MAAMNDWKEYRKVKPTKPGYYLCFCMNEQGTEKYQEICFFDYQEEYERYEDYTIIKKSNILSFDNRSKCILGWTELPKNPSF